MADKSGIEWTDATWNPIAGCSIVSPACTNCYAMAMAARIERMQPNGHYAGLTKPSKSGPVWTGKIAHAPDHTLTAPLRWKKPRRIFVNSMSDLFHEAVEDWKIVEIYGLMIAAHHLRGHTFQWLTKRSARARKILNDAGFWDEVNDVAGQEILDRCDPLNRRQGDARATCDDYSAKNPPPAIWAGVTAEDQTRADERIPDLLATPAAVRFVSIEPMLGPIKLNSISAKEDDEGGEEIWIDALTGEIMSARTGCQIGEGPVLDLIIAGGESGPNARPSHPDWFRSLASQCQKANVPFFFKQWGEWETAIDRDKDDPDWRKDYSSAFSDGGKTKWLNLAGGRGFHGDRFHVMRRVGKRRAGSLLDGVEHKEFPQEANNGDEDSPDDATDTIEDGGE